MRNNNSLPRKKRHKKLMNAAKGFFGSRSKHFKCAKEAVLHSKVNKTVGRKIFKRDIRRLWITRINIFARKYFNMSYSIFMCAIKNNKILLNRKIISDMITQETSSTIEFFKEKLEIK